MHLKRKEEGDLIERKVKGKIIVEEVGKLNSNSKKHVIVKGMKNYRFENEHFVSLRRAGNIQFDKIQLENVPIGHVISKEKKMMLINFSSRCSMKSGLMSH